MEDEINEMITELFDEFMSDGFTFESSMTFDEVFKQIFSAAVLMTINVLEGEEEEQYVLCYWKR